MPIEQSLPLLPGLIIPKSCLTRRADLNGCRSFALSPANSRLLANRDPVASAQCSNHRWYGNASLNQPNRLDCGGARLSGNRGATRADNLSSMYVRIFLMTTGSSMQAMTLAVPPQTRHVSTSISPKAPTFGEYPLCRCHQRTVFAVRGEYTVKTCQIDSGLGHQCGQLGNKIHRLKDHVGGAIAIRRFQLISNLALIRQRQPLFGYGRTGNVTAQALQFVPQGSLSSRTGPHLLALIGLGRYPRMQRKTSRLTRTATEGFFNSRQCLQREYFASLLRSHRDAVGNGMPPQLIHWIFI